ncbi:MAG: hypothetical protein MJB14_15460 [Spirochaetes bacterium]|nr:hypothetical protein [Spirochaetota bacterium]
MSKALYSLLIVFLMISCLNNNDSTNNQNSSTTALSTTNANSDQSIIMGLVELGMENQPVIVTRWTSRSRISHYVKGKYSSDIKKQQGKFIKVSGKIVENPDNPFKKDITVYQMIKVSDKPIED